MNCRIVSAELQGKISFNPEYNYWCQTVALRNIIVTLTVQSSVKMF